MCDCVLAALTRDLVSHDTELTTRSHSYRGTISPVHPRENYCQCSLMLPCEPTLADAFQIRNISWHTVTADGFKHEANRLSRYVHLNKKITQHTLVHGETRIMRRHLQCFSSCSSTTHEMLLPNKQANQQNKLSTHVRAIGGTGSGRDETSGSSVNKRSGRGRPSAARLAVEVLHVIH